MEASTACGAQGKILTLRMGKAKAGPVVSDNGNFIVDAPFPREMMLKPAEVSLSSLALFAVRHADEL